MEISMSGPDPPPPPKMEKLFLIFLGIRPFFENTLKNSHFALENANFGVEISTKDLKFKVRLSLLLLEMLIQGIVSATD